MRDKNSRFLTSKQKHHGGDKGSQFSICLNTVTFIGSMRL